MKAISTSWKINYKDTRTLRVTLVVGSFTTINEANAVKMATVAPVGTFPEVVSAKAKIIDDANVAAYAAIFGNS